MFKLGIALSVAALAAAQEQEYEHPINEEIVAAIRENNIDWEAWDPSENPLRHLTHEEIKGMLGLPPVDEFDPEITIEEGVSNDDFDARRQFGEMCPSVRMIRDQQRCGSCWAFGAAEAFTDRLCIASHGEI